MVAAKVNHHRPSIQINKPDAVITASGLFIAIKKVKY